jgi:hypothetical protein
MSSLIAPLVTATEVGAARDDVVTTGVVEDVAGVEEPPPPQEAIELTIKRERERERDARTLPRKICLIC